jgi:hypothetical protein
VPILRKPLKTGVLTTGESDFRLIFGLENGPSPAFQTF